MKIVDNILKFIFVSSSNADQVSLTLKMILLGFVPYLMQAIGLSCGLHLVCLSVTGDEINTIILSISNAVYLILAAVSAVGTLYGLLRKITKTATGTNAAFVPPTI